MGNKTARTRDNYLSQVRQLPLNGRDDWLQLAELQAGVVGGIAQPSAASYSNSRAARGNGTALDISGNRAERSKSCFNALMSSTSFSGSRSPAAFGSYLPPIWSGLGFIYAMTSYSAREVLTGNHIFQSVITLSRGPQHTLRMCGERRFRRRTRLPTSTRCISTAGSKPNGYGRCWADGDL